MKKVRLDDIKELRIECPKCGIFEVYHAHPLEKTAEHTVWAVDMACGYSFTQRTGPI